MRFSENGYYIEKYLKCANCGLLIYGQGIRARDGGPHLYCSDWCVEWAALRERNSGYFRLPIEPPQYAIDTAAHAPRKTETRCATAAVEQEQGRQERHRRCDRDDGDQQAADRRTDDRRRTGDGDCRSARRQMDGADALPDFTRQLPRARRRISRPCKERASGRHTLV